MLAIHTAEDRLTYGSFVESVIAQVRAGLETNRTSNSATDEDDPINQVAKRLKITTDAKMRKMPRSYQTADARFALGSNDSIYLSNAVSLLCADLANGVEEPLTTGTVFGPEVIDGVRRAIEIDNRRRKVREEREAPKELLQCVEVVLWLLSIPEVRESVKHFFIMLNKIDALKKPYVEDKEEGSTPSWDELLKLLDKDNNFAEYPAFFKEFLRADAANNFNAVRLKLLKLVVAAISSLMDETSPPCKTASGIIQDITKQTRAVMEAPEKILQSTAGPYEDTSDDRNVQLATEIDDRRNDEELFVDPINTRYSRSIMAVYCEQRGLIGRMSPIETNDGYYSVSAPPYSPSHRLRYSMPTHFRGAMVLSQSMADNWFQGVPPCTDDVVGPVFFDVDAEELKRRLSSNYAVMPMENDTADTIEDITDSTYPGREGTLNVRWMPSGDMVDETCYAVALEHAIRRCIQLATRVGVDDDDQKVMAYATAAALKLKQLPSLYDVRKQFTLHGRRVNVVGAPTGPRNRGPVFGPAEDAEEEWVTKPVIVRTNDDIADDAEPIVYDAAAAAMKRRKNSGNSDDSDGSLEESTMEFAHFYKEVNLMKDNWNTDGRKALPSIPVELQNEQRSLGPTGWLEPHQITETRLLGAMAYTNELIDKILRRKQPEQPEPLPSFTAPSYTAPTAHTPKAPSAGSAEAIRTSLWSDMLRDLSISNDRMWIFIKTLSGAIGEEANSLLNTADEQAQAAQRAFEIERKSIADKVATFQSKLIETVVGSVLRTSKLELQPNGEELVVLDAEAAKDLRALASGESGRPFFDANVAIAGIIEQQKGTKTSLVQMISSLNGIVEQVHEKLLADLQGNTATSRTVSIGDLALPRNSYFVSLRADVVAAIRTALDRLRHATRSERPSLYELVEGACPSLSLRFAELVGHVLVQIRTTTGTSALYVSSQQQIATALHARSAMTRLLSEVQGYLTVKAPEFQEADGRKRYLEDAAQKGVTNGLVSDNRLALVGRVHVAQLVAQMPLRDGWSNKYTWSTQNIGAGFSKA